MDLHSIKFVVVVHRNCHELMLGDGCNGDRLCL